MRCNQEKLSALLDGDLDARSAAKVRAHVDGCAACTRSLGELQALTRGLSELPNPEGRDQWSVLVNRLAAEPPRPLFTPVVAWYRRRFVLPTLGVAMAAVVGAGLAKRHHGRGLSDDAVMVQAESEFRAADAHYRRAVDELRAVAEKQRHDWAPPKRAEYDAAQAQLEAAVERCRAVAGERPADAEAEALLFTSYQKEIRFYEDQMMRAMTEAR